MKIGDRIRIARENKGITQEELGRLCGTTKQTIFKYESGIITNIPLDRLELIADALDVSPAHIMGWEDITTRERLLRAKNEVEHINDQLENYTPLPGSRRPPTDEEIKFALFDGAADVTDEMYAEVKRFAAYVYNREEKK